jgi:hypothetical protein
VLKVSGEHHVPVALLSVKKSQNQSGRFEEKKSFTLPGLEPHTFPPVAWSLYRPSQSGCAIAVR